MSTSDEPDQKIDPEAVRAQNTARAVELLKEVGDLLDDERVYPWNISKHVPHQLTRAIRDDAASEWFAGPSGVGAALYQQPIAAAGWLGMEGEAVCFAASLTGNIERLLTQWQTIPTDTQLNTYSELDMWWSMLKGYISAAVDGGDGTDMVAMLVHRGDLIDRICAALENGLAFFGTTPRPTGFKPLRTTSPIDDKATGNIVAGLRRRFKAEQRRVERYKAAR